MNVRNMKSLICCLFLVFITTTQAFAIDKAKEDQLKIFYKKAEDAIAAGKVHEADFWMARHMAIRLGSSGLWPLIKKRELKPTSFISGKFSESFLEFFIISPTQFWDRPDNAISEKELSFVIRDDKGKGFYADFYGSPALEDWYIIKKKPEQAVIPFIAFDPVPTLEVGRLGKNGEPIGEPIEYSIETDGRYIQAVWPIEFINLDGDNVPSIFMRYNVACADGFEQRLDILKIVEGKKVVIFKRFVGQVEGIARRLPDGKIEVGEGTASKDSLDHMSLDRHQIETWGYKNKTFVKIGERTVPHILWTDEWEKYYFPQSS